MKNINFILIFTMLMLQACTFGDESEAGAGGGLFSGHKEVTNVFALVPPSSGNYKAGDVISFSIVHPGILTVAGGVPSIDLTIGGATVAATYTGGSGTRTLSFTYTVQAGETDADGVDVGNSLALNGATVTFPSSTGPQNVVTTIPGTNAANTLVDTTAPSITLVTPPGDDTYLNAQELSFIAVFDEVVDIVGVPSVQVDIGGTIIDATYVSGTGTQNILFKYTVQSADMDVVDGIQILSPLVLNGGAIEDAAGNATALAHTPVPTPNVLVNGNAPFVTTITPNANGTYIPGEKVTLDLTFNEAVTVTGGVPSVNVDIGGNIRTMNYTTGSGTSTLSFEYTIITGDVDEDGVGYSNVIDLNGASIQDASFTNAMNNFDMPLTPAILVDGLLPVVTTITPPADNTYLQGEELLFSFVYNTEVTITGGTPRLAVTLETGTIYLDYNSGSGTDTHIYRYVVQAGDHDLDGIALSVTLDNNGAILQDWKATNADTDLTTPVGAINTIGILIDALAPTITTVTAPADGNYNSSQNLDFTVSFSEIVNVVGGTPRIALDFDSGTVYADYLSGTGTTDLIFRYSIGGADSDVDGISFNTTSLELNGGAITDTNSINASLDFTAIAPNISGITISGTGPVITNVSTLSPGNYDVGQNINFTVDTSQVVNVDTVGGTPRLEITLNTGTVYADYLSGTGTQSLTFQYTVLAGDQDLDGIEVVSPIQLNGGTILNAALDSLNLIFTPPTTNTVFVDGADPYVTSVTPPANNTYAIGDTIDFIVNFHEAVSITNTPRLVLDIGGVTKYADYSAGTGTSAITFTYTVIENDLDADGIQITNTNIDLNTTGVITDTLSHNANLDLTATTALPNLSAVLVEAIRPTVTGVSIPASTNIVNDVVTISVTFDEAITVAGGSPEIPLNFNTSSATPTAVYNTGDGTTTLTFDYTVVAGNEDMDGIDLATAITLAGATLQDQYGNDAALTLSTTNFPAVLIDAIIPIVTITGPLANINIANETTYFIDGTCSENGEVVTVNIGGVSATPTCTALAWSTTMDLSPVAESADNTVADVAVTADQTSAGGNNAIQATDTIIKDTILPTVSSNSIAAQTHIIGDTVQVSVVFNEDVTVDTGIGTPRLLLTFETEATGPVYANYVSGTGTNTLVFEYTVTSGDEDINGIVNAATIDANGGSIADNSNNATDYNMATTANASSFVDGIAPTITSVTIPANTYNETDVLTITVVFDDNVTVAIANPEIDLTFDSPSGTNTATYTGGTTTTTLTFDHTVVIGNEDINGIDLAASINLAGATIQDANGNDALLALSTTNFPTVIIDAVLPIVTITSPADLSYINIANDSATFPVSGNCDQAGQVVNILVDGVNATSQSGFLCNGVSYTGTIDTTGLAEGVRAFTAELPDGNGNTGGVTASANNVTKDTVAPAVAITNPADTTYINIASDSATFTVDGTCDENTATVNIQVDGVDATSQVGFTCDGTNFTGTIDTTGLAEGARSFTAIITDAAGNETTSTANSVTKDTVAPTIAISNPADSSFILLADDSATYAVNGTCSENGQTVSIEIDASAAPSQVGFVCDGTNFSGTIDTTGYVDGTYAFTALITDVAGNPVTTTANIVNKDITPPAVAITSPLDSDYINIANDSATYAVSGTCNENTQVVDIRIDGVSAAGQSGFVCDGTNFTGTIDTTGITEGALVMTAYLEDLGGNNAISTGINLTKDTIAPTIAMITPADASFIGTADDSATYAVSGTCSENGQTVSIELDATPAASQVGFACDGINFTGTIDTTGLADATYAFTAIIIDVAGNSTTSTANNVTKDVVAPTVALTTPADSSYINIANDNVAFAIAGTCDDASATYTLKIDGLANGSASCDGTNLSGSFDSTLLTEAAHTIEVDAIDSSGNSSTSNQNNFTRDVTAPIIAITPAAADIGIANVVTYSLAGTCNEEGATVNIGLGGLTNTATCTAGAWSIPSWDVSPEGDATGIVVTADITDVAGNPATQATDTVDKDSNAPTVALTTPADSSYINIANDNVAFAIAGTCDDATATYTLKIDGAANGSASCDGTNLSGSFDSTALTEAAHNIEVDAVDGVGNSSTSNENNFTRDVTAPTISITPAAADVGAPNVATYSIAGNCSEAATTVNLGFGGLTNTATCNGTSWSISNWDVSPEGDATGIVVTADITDVAGNPATQATDTVDKDSNPPTVALTTPADLSVINLANDSASFAIAGTCDDAAATYTLKIDGGATGSASCDGTNLSGSFDSTALLEGAHTIIIDAIDVVGNTSSSNTNNFTRDVTAATITSVTTANAGNLLSSVPDVLTYTVTFSETVTVTTGLNLDVTFDSGVVSAACGTVTGGTQITCTYTIQAGDSDDNGIVTAASLTQGAATVTDANGNTSSNFTFTAPDTSIISVNSSPKLVWRDNGGTVITTDVLTIADGQRTYQVYNDSNVATTDMVVAFQNGRHEIVSQTCGLVLAANTFCEVVVQHTGQGGGPRRSNLNATHSGNVKSTLVIER